jgi:adenylate cyclase
MKRALELDPLSLLINRDLGDAFYHAREYDQAIAQYQKTLELDPNFMQAHGGLGMAYLQKLMYNEGTAELQKVYTVSPGSTGAMSRLGYAYAVAGRTAEAQQFLDKLIKLSKQEYVPAVYMARIYSGLKQKDKAFEWLEKSYADRSISAGISLKLNPLFDPLRSDPRRVDEQRPKPRSLN